jgi:hypothetical protein
MQSIFDILARIVKNTPYFRQELENRGDSRPLDARGWLDVEQTEKSPLGIVWCKMAFFGDKLL